MPGRRRAQGRIGSVIKDKWRIDERLGAGGMATVYAATHRNGNRVAIKMLHFDYSRDATLRARFLREGYVANAVGHPGAVKVLDDDTAEDGSAFLVMELLEGESLEARRDRLGGKLQVDEVFTVGDELLNLLAVAHGKGIIHRDIKPENVFVTHEGAIKLLDFGIARMRQQTGDAERTGTGLMLGTPDFMSPEQAGGHPDDVDARSDLWAVGATMFTLLSGQSVHQAETLRDHLIAVATRPVRSLATAAPTVPRKLVSVVDRALDLDKDRRWPDARAMQDALRWALQSTSQTHDAESITLMDVAPASTRAPRREDTAPTVEVVPKSVRSERPPAQRPPPPPSPPPQVQQQANWSVAPPPLPRSVPPASPATVGPHFSVPGRVQPPQGRGRILVMAFIVLLAVGAGFATFFAATRLRGRTSPPRNAAPAPTGAETQTRDN